MNPNESKGGNTVIALTGELKNSVIDELEKQGAVFFSLEQLVLLIRQFGPDAPIAKIIKVLRDQKEERKKQ